jgi:3-hydroxyacyl-[acyl-carrier-protein] dehydratase
VILGIDQILEILPHKPPLLMVDGVSELTEERVLAFKNVSANEPHFAGHFPGMPVMPGVLIVEAMAQSAVLLAHVAGVFDPKVHVVYFMTIESAKFRSPVRPGHRLELDVRPLRKGSAVWKFEGVARVGDQIVAEATFVATLAKRNG